jgi:hypothetical protein
MQSRERSGPQARVRARPRRGSAPAPRFLALSSQRRESERSRRRSCLHPFVAFSLRHSVSQRSRTPISPCDCASPLSELVAAARAAAPSDPRADRIQSRERSGPQARESERSQAAISPCACALRPGTDTSVPPRVTATFHQQRARGRRCLSPRAGSDSSGRRPEPSPATRFSATLTASPTQNTPEASPKPDFPPRLRAQSGD